MTLVSDEEIIDIWEYAKAYWARHAADPRNSNNEGASMDVVIQVTNAKKTGQVGDYVSHTPGLAGIPYTFGYHQDLKNALTFSSPYAALRAIEARNERAFAEDEVEFGLVPVELIPPSEPDIRRLI